MKAKSTTQKPRHMALLLAWRDKGYTRPRFGLVDDEELLHTDRSNFLCTGGQSLLATPNKSLILQEASDDHSEGSPISPPSRHPIRAQPSNTTTSGGAGE